MVAGYHLIWTAYGWWLPNDPRGSSSHEIRVERIAALGELHHGRKAIQPPTAELRRFYAEAGDLLRHPLNNFAPDAVAIIATAFGQVIAERRYTCYACAIMPERVHILVRKHKDKAEEMIAHLQAGSKERLVAQGLFQVSHPVWGGPGWKVFLNTRRDMERIVNYIRENPIKVGLPDQRWPFVKEYDGWLPRER